jgi:phosphatidylserine/phosphatidylglycerophosphate/cardiolipin synthase-like enzyme
MTPSIETGETDGLRVVVYAGDNKILIAMSLPDEALDETDKILAGFAIWRTVDGRETVLSNRISFHAGVSQATPAEKWTPSDQAPFQKFRWIDVPPDGFGSAITYRVQALYFVGQTQALRSGPETSVTIKPAKVLHTQFRPAFTRGYIASQAYADKFHNADIRPKGPKTPTFDTAPFQQQYEWLGADARQELFDFIDDCKKDDTCFVDVFAYDLDEPDVIAAICDLGRHRPGRVRAILDNADLHAKADKKTGQFPPEVEAAKMIKAALGEACVKQGHFGRYQHNKVFIKRDKTREGEKVIFGSMNFSVRGMYVQANNVIVVDDGPTADKFAEAFDVAFKTGVAAPPFRKDAVAQGYMVASKTDTAQLPKFSLALSPHTNAMMSLGPMVDRIRHATSSVLFAVMEPKGTGPVLTTLRTIAAKATIFSYGTVETDKGLAVQSPDGAMGDITGFAALTKNVPEPFTREFDGGPGKHIHDKFVVVDFNADNPTVFTGSSNLAAGGEQQNGDSLAMIEDAAIANMYAIEAVALFDHYHFRKKMRAATSSQPFALWYPNKPGMPKPWWTPSYDPTQIQMRDRYLFAGLPLPEGLAATKSVDWAALDEADAATKPAGRKAAKPQVSAAAKRARPAPKKAKTPKKTTEKTPKKKTKAAKAAKKVKKTAKTTAAKTARKTKATKKPAKNKSRAATGKRSSAKRKSSKR